MDVVITDDKRINLSMVRGDTEEISLSIVVIVDGVPEEKALEDGDTLFFTVKKHANEESFLLQKVVTEFHDGKAQVTLEPEDTNSLSFGTYVYDVQVTFSTGVVKTVIKESKFVLETEVTHD